MPIDLPALPKLATVTPQLLSFGGDLAPTLGGATQRIRRLGSRYAVEVTIPALDADCGQDWIARRLKAETEADTLRLAWPQPAQSGIGSIAVGGGGQVGSLLNVTGSGLIKAGRFFSFVSGGRSYLHAVTADVTLAGSGQVSIAPMLRVSPPSGAALNLAAPLIEGFCDDVKWSLDRLRLFGQTFTLTEAE